MIKAYRDTWTLGVHSYLAYLRDRLSLSRELLTDTGSIFVQISDENLHRVRALLDEVFGAHNYAGLISFSATTGQTSDRLAQITGSGASARVAVSSHSSRRRRAIRFRW